MEPDESPHPAPRCCFLDDSKTACGQAAEWEVRDGPTTDDYTHGCSDHVGHLLRDCRTSTVVPIP